MLFRPWRMPPGALDFYLSWFGRTGPLAVYPARISVLGPGGLNEQLGVSDYSLDRRFRYKILSWLSKVKAFWPECPACLSADRRLLIVHSSRNQPAIRSVTTQRNPRIG